MSDVRLAKRQGTVKTQAEIYLRQNREIEQFVPAIIVADCLSFGRAGTHPRPHGRNAFSITDAMEARGRSKYRSLDLLLLGASGSAD